MARRTKEDAAATRNRLLDAAELLFCEKGVAHTSLNDIALAADATRGAVYWHFKDKAYLFNAMMERVTLPLELAPNELAPAAEDPLSAIRTSVLHALDLVANDAQTRRVFEVATQKVEYVEGLLAVKQRHRSVCQNYVAQLQIGLRAAAVHHAVQLPLPDAAAAQGLHALVGGLIHNWLLAPEFFDLMATGQAVLDCYLAGLGFAPCRASAETLG